MSLIRTTNGMGQRILITSHAVAVVEDAAFSAQIPGVRSVIRLLDGSEIGSQDTYQTIVNQMATPDGFCPDDAPHPGYDDET